MDSQAIQELLEQGIADSQVRVGGDGRHIDAIIVASAFAGKNTLQRQQMVYAVVSEAISRGDIHAFTMKTYTPEEWSSENE